MPWAGAPVALSARVGGIRHLAFVAVMGTSVAALAANRAGGGVGGGLGSISAGASGPATATPHTPATPVVTPRAPARARSTRSTTPPASAGLGTRTSTPVTPATRTVAAVVNPPPALTHPDALALAGRSQDALAVAATLDEQLARAVGRHDRAVADAQGLRQTLPTLDREARAASQRVTIAQGRLTTLRSARSAQTLLVGSLRTARAAEGEERVGVLRRMGRKLFGKGASTVSTEDLIEGETAAARELRLIDQEIAALETNLPTFRAAASDASARHAAQALAVSEAGQAIEELRGHAQGLALRRDQELTNATTLEADAHATQARENDKAQKAADRRTQSRALQDQHALSLGATQRRSHAAAARRFGVIAVVHSKPGKTSEDAVATAPAEGRYAIADGVTNSAFSGPFARAIVRRWVGAGPTLGAPGTFDRLLADAQADWDAETGPELAELSKAYYNQGKTFIGHAAFVGVQLGRDGNRRVLKALALGDSALFVVRNGRLLKSFPQTASSEFSSRLHALPSVGTPSKPMIPFVHEVQTGDEVFMATDALSKWILEEVEAGRDPFTTLRAADKRPAFASLVDGARQGKLTGHGTLDLDDTSMIRFVIPAPGSQP